ncbi:hypothetical protein O6H91_15G005500 [Diphasiastrum complanatum]|nr:hypothetical protein O6H91_15G005500 [Diphasiastrum complanatum]KAJ7528492.1 hypothetical protein O6H91_15G005500 [Diphasiastrum complanatum]
MDIDRLSHPPVAVALPDRNSFWDVDNKVSASCSQDLSQTFDRKYKSRIPADTDISSGRGSFILPNSKGEWSPCDTDLEARLDRYRRNNQDSAATDLFASKDSPSPSDWKSQERKSLGNISPLNSIATKQFVAEGGMKLPGYVDAPSFSPSVISPCFLRQDTSCDEINHSSPRKRPRLGWGQGLAKYEKKKVVVHEKVADPLLLQEKSEADLESSEVPGIRSTGLAISMVCGEDAGKCLLLDVSSKGDFMEDESRKDAVRLENVPVMCKQGLIDGGNKSLEESQSGHKWASFPKVSYVRENEPCLESTPASEQTSEHKFIESYAYPFENVACLSKGIILLNIEKVELEIDLVEKELANLNFEIQPQDLTNLYSTDNGQLEQGAVNSGSLVSSDPQSSTVSSDKVTLARLSSFEEKCTVNSVQTSGGIDSHDPDAMAVVVKLEGDEIQQDVTSDNSECQNLIYESTNEIDVSMKSTESLVEEQTLLVSNICKNGDLTNEEGSFLNSKNYGALSSFYQAIINENQEQANDGCNAFLHLLPSNLLMMGGTLYSSPEGAPKWIQNDEFHQRTKEELKERLARRKKVFRFKEQVLALRYQALSKIWKQEQLGLLQRKDRSKVIRKYDGERRNVFLSNNQRSSSRLRLLSFGIAKHDTLSEELPVVKKLLLQSPSEKGYLKMPAMIIEEKERSSRRFVTINALVEDPVAVEQERSTINPWTLEEKQVFLEKFAMFHKNFAKIASFIPQKAVADCIEFYYRNQKSEDFEKVHHRQQQLKKRRDLTRCSPYLATTSRANRFCESNAARVDALSMVAALASADSFARDYTRSTRHGSSKSIVRSRIGSAAEPGSVDGFGAQNSPGISEMKFLSTEARIDSGCALALCSLSSAALLPSEKGSVGRIGDNGRLSTPSVTKKTNTRHLTRPKGARNVPIQKDSAKASREQVDSHWSDRERKFFLDALKLYGRNFSSIALHVGTKTVEQCKGFFSKTRKRLGLDELLKLCPPKVLPDHDEEMGQPEQALEIGKWIPNPKGVVIMADLTNFLKDEPQCSTAEARTVELLETHSDVRNEPEAEEKVSLDTCSRIDQDYGVAGGGEKRLEQVSYTGNDAAVKDVQLREFNVDTQLKSTILIEDQVKKNAFNTSILSCKSDANQSDARSILSVREGDIDVERSDCSEFEVQKAKQDALAVIETMRIDGDTFELKEAFVSEVVMQADISGSHIDVDSEVKDKEETLEPKHDNNKVVGTIHLTSVGGKASFPPLVLQPHLDPTNSSSTCPDVPQKGKCSKVLVGGEAKLRREPACWTPEEKEKFVAIIRKHGKSWSLLQESLPAKSLTQIKTYFQNSKAKLGYRLTELIGNKADKVSSRKRKADDSDTSSNAGSVGQVSQHSSSYFLEDGVLKSSVVGMNLTASTVLGTAMPSVGQTDRDLTSIKGIQITQQVSSGGFASKSATFTEQEPASVSGTQINPHMFSSSCASQGLMPTSYPRFDSASSDLPTRSYDCHPQMYMQVFGSNLQNREQVVHDQEQSINLQQDTISQQQKQQELLAMLQQQQHIMHQIQQHQRMEAMSKSPLLHSQTTYPEQIQTAQTKQLQQGSLLSGLQHMQVLQSQKQNKGAPSKQQQQLSLQAENKHPQVYDVGRIVMPYHTVIQNQSFTQKENDWEQVTHDKQKVKIQQSDFYEQVANHGLQQPSQQSEVQLWQRHQQQFIHQKQQEQLIQFHLQQRLQLQQQHLLKPLDKQLTQDHQQLMSQQHHHQISSNFQPNASQIRKNQQHLRQQLLLQHQQAIPVQQHGIIKQGAKSREHVQPHQNDHFTDQEQREPSQLAVSSPLSKCALPSIMTTIEVPCQAGQVDCQTLCETTSEPRNQKNLSMSCETQMAQIVRGGDIKLFGQSLLSQPSSVACQTGTISTGSQNQTFENVWLPLNSAPDCTAKKLSKRYEKHSVKVLPSSPLGNASTTGDLNLSTWLNATTSGNIDLCNGAWSGLQTNPSAASVRDAESCDDQNALSHSEICHLSQLKDSRISNPEVPFSPSKSQQIEKPDRIKTDKEYERWGSSRNDDLCMADRQTCLMPVAGGLASVDSRSTNPSSRASGTDRLLRLSEGLDSSMAAAFDDSILRNMGFLSKSINTFPSLSSATNSQVNEDDRQFAQLPRVSGSSVEATRLSGPYALSPSTSQSRTVVSELFETLKNDMFLAPYTKSEW